MYKLEVMHVLRKCDYVYVTIFAIYLRITLLGQEQSILEWLTH